MGSNVSVIYTILFMPYLELQLYINVRYIYIPVIMQSTLSAHGRDLLMIVLSSGTTDMSFNLFNLMISNLDPTIKFTKEDNTKELPFLDITVIKNHDNSIAMHIFYKKTNSHRYLDFRSRHRHHTKVTVTYNLAQRICKIVSDKTRREYTLQEVKGFLLSCCYPQKLVDHAIRNAKERITPPSWIYLNKI